MEFWAFLLLGLGLVFIALEVFFPSFGLLGTIAAGCIVAGGVLAFRADDGSFVLYLVLALVLGPLVAGIGLKMFPHTRFGKKLMLAGTSFRPEEAAAGGAGEDFAQLADKIGTSETPLRPAGKAMFDGRRVDVVTRGEMIERGRPVKVLRIEGNKVFVSEVRA